MIRLVAGFLVLVFSYSLMAEDIPPSSSGQTGFFPGAASAAPSQYPSNNMSQPPAYGYGTTPPQPQYNGNYSQPADFAQPQLQQSYGSQTPPPADWTQSQPAPPQFQGQPGIDYAAGFGAAPQIAPQAAGPALTQYGPPLEQFGGLQYPGAGAFSPVGAGWGYQYSPVVAQQNPVFWGAGVVPPAMRVANVGFYGVQVNNIVYDQIGYYNFCRVNQFRLCPRPVVFVPIPRWCPCVAPACAPPLPCGGPVCGPPLCGPAPCAPVAPCGPVCGPTPCGPVAPCGGPVWGGFLPAVPGPQFFKPQVICSPGGPIVPNPIPVAAPFVPFGPGCGPGLCGPRPVGFGVGVPFP